MSSTAFMGTEWDQQASVNGETLALVVTCIAILQNICRKKSIWADLYTREIILEVYQILF